MIREYPQYIEKIRSFGHFIHGFRVNDGMAEFALKTCNNELHWFPYYRLSERAEIYIAALWKTGAFDGEIRIP